MNSLIFACSREAVFHQTACMVQLPISVISTPAIISCQQESVNLELEKIVKQGVIKSIQYCDYASTIVNVFKPYGSGRTCTDYKQQTLLLQLKVTLYLMCMSYITN